MQPARLRHRDRRRSDVLQEQSMEVARADSDSRRQRFHRRLVQRRLPGSVERAPDDCGRAEPGRRPRRRLRAAAQAGAKAGFGRGRRGREIAHVATL